MYFFSGNEDILVPILDQVFFQLFFSHFIYTIKNCTIKSVFALFSRLLRAIIVPDLFQIRDVKRLDYHLCELSEVLFTLECDLVLVDPFDVEHATKLAEPKFSSMFKYVTPMLNSHLENFNFFF